jgi:hypothetical protein
MVAFVVPLFVITPSARRTVVGAWAAYRARVPRRLGF